MRKIAVIGIAGESVFLSVDDFGKIGETSVAKNIHRELGGKGFNQAVAVANFGVKCSFLGAVNKNDVENYKKTAKDYGVNATFVSKEDKSPYAVIVTDNDGENKVFVYQGASLSVDDVNSFEQEIKSADLLLITNETPIEVNRKAVEIAKSNGVKVVLNPAPYRLHDKKYLEKIDLFTPNEHETKGLEDFSNVVTTLGAKGCLINSTGEIIPAEKVQTVVDTTGAGDTFNGVLTACIVIGMDIKSACETANVASALKVQKKHVLDGIPTKKEIENHIKNKQKSAIN